MAVARRRLVALERALDLAEADRAHLQEAAAQARTGEVRMGLHPVHQHDRVGLERVLRAQHAESQRGAAHLDGFHVRADRRADEGLGDSEGLEHVRLAGGGPAAMAAHGRHDERQRAVGLQGLDHRLDDRRVAVDAAAARGHGDATSGPGASGQDGFEPGPGLHGGIRQGVTREAGLDEQLRG